MPRNKVSKLLEDVMTVPYIDHSHVTRVGLMAATVAKAPAVFMKKSDMARLADVPPGELDLDSEPVTLQIEGELLFMLLAPNKEEGRLEVYPFTDQGGKIWPYDLGFSIDNELKLSPRAINPLADYQEMDAPGKLHLEALALIASRFSMAKDHYDLKLSGENLGKINRKRIKNRREPLIPDTEISWK